jgi:copper transport protein
MHAHGIEPIRAEAREDTVGTWRAGPVHLPMGGNWDVTKRLVVSDFETDAIHGTMTQPP